VRQLVRLHFDRHVGEVKEFAVEIHDVLGERGHHHFHRLCVHGRGILLANVEKSQLHAGDSAARSDFEAALGQMVEHADFGRKPQRVI